MNSHLRSNIIVVLLLLPALLPAQDGRIDPASHELPRVLFNDDGGELTSPAYGGREMWVPAGPKPSVEPVRTVADCLNYRIGPLVGTAAKGLSFCGNFGSAVWELPPARLAALGSDPLLPIIHFWRREGRPFFFSMRMNDYHHG